MRRDKTKKIILWSSIVIAILIILVFWAAQKAPDKIAKSVPCISGNFPIVQHIHPHLTIIVDGKNEIIPPDVGLSSSCERVLHTHETDGVVHVEANDNLIYTLGLFFNVWEKSIERSGYGLSVSVGGESYFGKPEDILLKDKEEILLTYTSKI